MYLLTIQFQKRGRDDERKRCANDEYSFMCLQTLNDEINQLLPSY